MNATKNAVLKYSFFSPALTRALKENAALSGSGSRIHCNVDDDGMIYVCTGYFAVKLTATEYDALVRPVTQRDAGKWILNENGGTSPDPIDIMKIMDDADKTASHVVTAAPMFFDMSKGKKSKANAPQLVGYYSETGDFVTAFNSHYAAIVSPDLERKSKGSSSPMLVYSAGSPVAMILPVRVDENSNSARAIRAWFIDNTEEAQAKKDQETQKLRDELNRTMEAGLTMEAENKELRRQLEELRQQYAEKHIEAEELKTILTAKNEQIETLVERLNAQPDPQPQETAADPQPQDKAAALVEKLAALPGVTATVKGAQTAAPVVWLTGNTDAHKDKIEEMGGKWSGKRSAWYFKI